MLSKQNRGNIIILLLVLIFLFTPVRSYIQKFFLPEPKVEESNVKSEINLDKLNLPLSSYSNKQINLNQLKGKVVFLNYFGTWCPPCVAEMPSIQKLYQAKGKDVEFILIPINDTPEKVKAFFSENSYNIPVYEPQDVLPQEIKPSVFPTVYIFDKNGKIVLKEEGASDWNSKKVHEFLDKLL